VGRKRLQSWFIKPFGAALPAEPLSFGKKTVKIKGFPFGFSTFKALSLSFSTFPLIQYSRSLSCQSTLINVQPVVTLKTNCKKSLTRRSPCAHSAVSRRFQNKLLLPAFN
jgi:hypothetical protein